jgi:DNA helicase IV
MIDKQHLTDRDLDAIIQDLSQKIAKAKPLQYSSEAFTNLQNMLNEYIIEMKMRYAEKMDKKSGVVIEADPTMADIPFVPPSRKIDTF